MKRIRPMKSLLSLVAAGLLTAPVAGQTRAGGGGHALDANRQVGSGGINNQQNQTDFRARNSVITGNVGEGRAFQGRVNYRAPGEFSGRLGSDELFNFRRNSISSSPTRLNNVQSYQNAALGSGTSIYRDYTGLNAVAPIQGRRGSGDILIGDVNPTLSGPTVGNELLGGVADVNERLGTIYDNQGRALELSASPLLGVRTQPQPGQTLAAPNLSASGLLRRPDLNLNLPNPGQTQNRQEEGVPDARLSPLAPGDRTTGPLTPMGVDAPSLTLGRELQRRTDESATGQSDSPENPTADERRGRPRDARLGGRLGRLERGIYQPLRTERTRQQAGEVYTDLLTRMRQQDRSSFLPKDQLVEPRDQDEQASERDQANATGQGRMEEGAAESGEGRTPDQPSPSGGQSETPSGGQGGLPPSQPNENPRGRGGNPEQGMNPPGSPRAGGNRSDRSLQQGQGENGPDQSMRMQRRIERMQRQGEQTGQQDEQAGQRARNVQRLNRMMSQLDYDMAPLDSLVGNRRTRGAQAMRQAEQALAAGDYLKAERQYRLARRASPNNPMAEVGLIHARLGAGLIRSAALGLRSLFEEHPELIATHYEPNLLPPEKRMQWLQQELRAMIRDRGGAAPAAGLMLGYLGYQMQSRPLIRYGLARAEEAAPKDPLLPLVRRIWLDQESGDRGRE